MKIFFPFKENKNKYLFEIQQYFPGDFIYGSIDDYKEEYDVVSIHWPEGFFQKEPTNEELEHLKIILQYWKKNSKIVYTRHNEKPHKRRSKNYLKLYDLIMELADGIIHLGEFSLEYFDEKYLNKNNMVIPHPLYLSLKNSLNKNQSRKKLKINKNKTVFLVFGALRTKEEKGHILSAFRSVNIRNKLLLIPKMDFFVSVDRPRFFQQVQKAFLRSYYYLHPNYKFNYRFIEEKNIKFLLNASDVVFVYRMDTLNSGNIFLGITFNREVCGPKIGNMSDVLEEFHYPTFDPFDQKDIIHALEKAAKNSRTNNNLCDRSKLMEKYHPKLIAQEYYNFFEQVKLNRDQ